MDYQEKLAVLVDSFRKLDEGRKDYIRELTRKLAEIHCGPGFRGEFEGNSHMRGENLGGYPA
jgi:hypothetical protein